MNILENNSWTDEFYRLAAFIYNEPQHLLLKKNGKGNMRIYEGAVTKFRTLEVPLNQLFNILLRLSPQRIKQRILSCFVPAAASDFGQQLEFMNSFESLRQHDLSFIYPDTLLHSETSHICLELKAKTPTKIGLAQTCKYLRFLGLWQTMSQTPKKPYLLFLTKTDLRTQWCSTERDKIFTGPDQAASLAHYLRTTQLSNPEHLALIEPVLSRLQVGWATWQMVGQALHEEVTLLRQSEASESREILENLLDDFVQELGRANLWQQAK